LPGGLPFLLSIHHNRFTDDLPYWRSLAREHGGPVLELGCGSGRVTLDLAAAGFDVTGVDRDPEALVLLQDAMPPGSRGDVTLLQADMRWFRLDLTFPLILMPCNTLSALEDGDRSPVFQRVAEHLADGGIFAASLPNPATLQDLTGTGDTEPEDMFTNPDTGNPVQVSSAWSRAGDRVEIYWHYDELAPDGSVRRSTASVSHSLATLEQYSSEFSDAGLRIVDAHGDFDGRPYLPDSPYLILLGR
jgi:SAM-dependent methyltransferase